MDEPSQAKKLGAYYTDPRVAEFLVRWALRKDGDLVMDPSFGDGVFLDAALAKLAGSPARSSQVYGVEIDKATYESVVKRLHSRMARENLVNEDFFDLDPRQRRLDESQVRIPPLDAIVGNPPFIRYHRFKGDTRRKAQEKAKAVGVELNGLSSSWAPFVVHAASFLRFGGRLAMVMPGEIMHATYSLPVLRFFVRTFQNVFILSFQKKLFPELSEDTVLFLADNKGVAFDSLQLVDVPDVDSLDDLKLEGVLVDNEAVLKGDSRLVEYLLPLETRLLYAKLKSNPLVKRLGDFGSVGIGYVTGDNDFFHLTRDQAREYSIPSQYLRECVRKSSQLEGIRFDRADFEALVDSGAANYLLDLNGITDRVPRSIAKYLAEGEKQGVDKTFKCRVRSPWWKVPHIYECDGLLTYLGGTRVRLVTNEAHVVAPNSLHIIRLAKSDEKLMRALAVSWLSSLTALSSEIEGRNMGGGLLKMEPSEAARTLVVAPDRGLLTLSNLIGQTDGLVKQGFWEEAEALVDDVVLKECMNLSQEEIATLRAGVVLLRKRRMNR